MTQMVPSTTLSQGRRIPALLAVLAAQFLAGLLMIIVVWVTFPWVAHSPNDQLLYVVLAISFAQITLLATWTAFGEGKFVWRSIGSLIGVIGIWMIGFGSMGWFNLISGHLLAPTGIAMFVQWILVLVPLWIARLTFRQFGMIGQQNKARGARDVQFGIMHMIIWMTFIAIVLGLGKYLLSLESVLRSRVAINLGIIVVCNSLFAWPTILGCLAVRWMPPAVFAAAVFAFLIAFVEPLIFQVVLGYNEGLSLFLWLDGIQFFWIAGSMLILRRFGFRLVRPKAT